MPRERTTTPLRADIAVVGAGAAGLYTALVAARAGAHVALVSSSPLAESASYWAQGGIAASLSADDSPELHARDTIDAGRGIARPSAVRALCAESPGCVRDLEALGVHFDADRRGALALGLEGGHSRRRVVHAGGSATGRRITRELSARVATDERIVVLDRWTATSLLAADEACVGVVAESSGEAPLEILSRGTILATGGAAALWERTTNPRGAVGAGMSLGAAAGAALADLEFVQFHPTALVAPGALDGFLITEAIRGEGALLVNGHGERFVDELAPRDEVAMAIEAARAGGEAVRLDMRAIDMSGFPNVAATLARAGFDPGREPVPVAPAAHYVMGGITTDLHGRSSLPGLMAVGECGCNGLHGANRLASNSLAECFVFGRRAAIAALDRPAAAAEVPRTRTPATPAPTAETRAALWRHAGILRTGDGLGALSGDPFPLARAVAACALAREESRGAHQRSDFPATDPKLDLMHSVLEAEAPQLERWD